MKMAKQNFGILGVLILTAACSSVDRSRTANKEMFSDPGQFESLASAAVENPNPVVPSAPATREIATEASILAAVPAVPVISKEVIKVVSPLDLAYDQLVQGNDRFVAGTTKGDHRGVERRRDLASGQKPFAIVLSCSDSRVPPELVFDQGLGDLFTVRVAGNVLGSAQVASIEYAIEHLGAKLIVVMGHESCGAVKAAIETKVGKNHASAGSQDLDWLIGAIRPTLKARGLASVTADDPKIRKPVTANIDAVTESLLVRSKIIGEGVEKGSLKIVRGIYALDTGKVDFWK